MNAHELLELAVRAVPDKEALYDRTRRLSYRELGEEVGHVAAALRTLGVRQGDRVGVALPNWSEAVALYFAVSRIGAVLVPFNPRYRTNEVRHILRHSGVRVLFVCEENAAVALESAPPGLETVTVRFRQNGLASYDGLLADSRRVLEPEPVPASEDDVFCMLYTSGTTGVPKGALVTHRCVVRSGRTIAAATRCGEDDVFLIVAPIFHVFGMACNLMAAVACRAKMVLLDRFKAIDALRLIEQERVTVQHAVPTMLNLELKCPEFDSFDLSSLRVGMTGASPCPPETIRGVTEKMGMRLLISYGTTETGTVTITEYDEREDRLYNSVGKAVEGVEVRIVDDARRPVALGEVGEIACRGFGVMKGYDGMPEQTREVLDEAGWYYTGDLGRMDEDGYVYYMGRKKELIIRGGYNIYPQELEGLLMQHPKVLECAVVGLPDPVMGEIVCAAVRLRPGESATEDELVDYLKGQVADYKLPSKVVFVDEFPATASGKIQKTQLRELIMAGGRSE